MKSRLSYFLIIGIIVLSIIISTFIWRINNSRQIPSFNKNSYHAPNSSKYIPRNSDIVFHWKLNPTLLPKYIESYQDQVNKNRTKNKISFIRDSSFKLIGLDFAKDISNWVGEYGSFALFDTNNQLISDWIMVLGVKDGINIKEELASISDPKNFDENINLINSLSTSETEIISKKINSNHSIYFSNNKGNVLIASNPKIIKSSIEQLDKNTLNTKPNYKYIQIKENINDGFLLFEASPKKILNIINEAENLSFLNETKYLISSISLDKNYLNLEGVLSFDVKTEMPVKNLNHNFLDIIKNTELSEDFILVDNPYLYFSKDLNHPYQKLIASLIQESVTSDNSNLFRIILKKSKGNLLWINDKNWLILTRKSDTNKQEITKILKRDNFLVSPLDFEDRKLEIWSKISTDKNEKYKIKDKIEAIIDEDDETYFWSQNLSSISNFNNSNYLQNYSDYEGKTDKVNDFYDVLHIHLGEEKIKTVLNNFYPYILLKSMLGNKLISPNNINLSVSVPSINYPDFIKFKINLETS